MIRRYLSSLIVALLTLLMAVSLAGPSLAAEYRAEPVYAPMRDQIVVRDLVWQRSGPALEAGKSNSRPAVVCAVLVHEVGQLKSFSIAGAPISPADLEKCNARAAH